MKLTKQQISEYQNQVDEGIAKCGIIRCEESETHRHIVDIPEDEPDCMFLKTEIYCMERACRYTVTYDSFDHYLSIHEEHVGRDDKKCLLNAELSGYDQAVKNVAFLIEVVI